MFKEESDLMFEDLFEQAVQESYEFTLKLSTLNLKNSWEACSKKMNEQAQTS